MDLVKVLKDVPKGTKLYSPMFGDVFLVLASGDFINVHTGNPNHTYGFNKEGKFSEQGDCMLFPSRENRDWNTFYICPFKKGDFIVREYQDGNKFIAIFHRFGGPYEYTTHYLCLLRPSGEFKPKSDFGIGNVQEARLATDSEKKELLDAITRNGYYWDECSMSLNKLTLKFKVGDTIHKEGGYCDHTIKSIEQDRYICESGSFLRFVDQHEWELAKFDIKELKPFDKVLVRDATGYYWEADFYSHYNENVGYKYICVTDNYNQCIPYNEDTKHLLGTKEDCPEYYKTW